MLDTAAIERQLQEAERRAVEAQAAFAALMEARVRASQPHPAMLAALERGRRGLAAAVAPLPRDLARKVTIAAGLMTAPYKAYADSMAVIQRGLGALDPGVVKAKADEAYKVGGQAAVRGVRDLLNTVTETRDPRPGSMSGLHGGPPPVPGPASIEHEARHRQDGRKPRFFAPAELRDSVLLHRPDRRGDPRRSGAGEEHDMTSRGGRPTKLTPTTHEQIVNFVRAGMYAHIAAGASGISARTFYNWLRRGRAGRRGRFVQFLRDVHTAQSQARGAAECRVYAENPLAWLRVGPGRERPGEPGWTESSQVQLSTATPDDPLRVIIEYVDVATGRRAPSTKELYRVVDGRADDER